MGKLFRVFFSSTFSDFVDERNALHKHVFPKIKTYCASQGARFQPIDLRWGIPDEIALQQSTMQICLDEIKRCQEHTPKPNFLVFLGERYGWCPPPAKIPKTEWDRISQHFSLEDVAFLDNDNKPWYRHDENELCILDDGSVTTVYELQPRGEKYEEYEKWEPVEINLRSILLNAARKANLSEIEMVKFYASVTHQEIIQGALNAEDADAHVHCYFRKLSGVPAGKSNIYQDQDPKRIQYLSNLKGRLQSHLSSTIHNNEVDFGNDNEKEEYLLQFCDDVHESLISTIEQELNSMEKISTLDEEIQSHIEFAKERSKVFVGREDIIQEILKYVNNESNIPFVVYGRSGSGKSALIAKIFDRLQKEDDGLEIVLRFIGTSTFSSNSVELLRSICEQIINRFGIEREDEIPFEYNKLVNAFKEILNAIQGEQKIVLVIDALDQYSKTDRGRDLAWLPSQLPENVKIITSYATDDTEIGNLAQKKLPNSLNELKPLTHGDGSEILEVLLMNSQRRLTAEQKILVLSKFTENGLPLYLKLAFEQARCWNSYDQVSNLCLDSEVNGVIQNLLERLYTEHTKTIVNRILSYIVASRNGLTEDEILGVMSSDSEFFGWYTKEQIHHKLPENRLPWIIWSRLLSDIDPYLTERGIDNTSTITFFHRQFNEYISEAILLPDHDIRHRILGEYFEAIPTSFWKERIRVPNIRKVSELNYHLLKIQSWDKLKQNLTSLEFMDAKCAANMTSDLQSDFLLFFSDIGKKVSPDLFRYYQSNVGEFQRFLSNQAHILRENSKKFPQLIGQQAANQPSTSIVSEAGIKLLKSFTPPLPWVEWRNKFSTGNQSILTFKRKAGRVGCCAFSPDGNTVLSGSINASLALWNAHTGEEIRTFTGHVYAVDSCLFSPDGIKILSASADKTLKLWDVQSGEEIRTFTGHSSQVSSCAFSPDGKTILSGAQDRMLKLWDVHTGKEIRTFTGHRSRVKCCAFSPDGNTVLSGSDDYTLKLWDVHTGEEIRAFTDHATGFLDGETFGFLNGVTSCAFSPDGNTIISGCHDKLLKLWDVHSGKEIRTFKGHSGYVTSCTFSPDGNSILSGSFDKLLILWNVHTGEKIHTFAEHSDMVTSCTFSPDGNTIISGSKDTTLKLWNVQTSEKTHIFKGHSKSVNTCAFSPDGDTILSGSMDNTLKLWDTHTGEEIHTFTGHSTSVQSCAFSPDGNTFLSGSGDMHLKLWDVHTREEIRVFKGELFTVYSCSFSPDGNRILSAADVDNGFKLWDVHTGKVIRTFAGHRRGGHTCSFSPDGKTVLTGSRDTTLKLWDIHTGEEIRTFTGHSNDVTSCAFSPDGNTILSGSKDISLKLWDTHTGEEIHTFTGQTSWVKCCAFSPDGNTILSGSWNNTLKLWNVTTRKNFVLFPTLGTVLCIATHKEGLIAVGDIVGNLYILKLHL